MLKEKRKGQMSLEMIIGLVILLVVATVVVTMFLNVFQSPNEGQTAISRNEILQSCESSCQQWRTSRGQIAESAAVKYCTETYTYDANGNNKKTDLIEQGYNSYCEDGVHCFNLHTCESSGTGGRVLDAEECKSILTDYFEGQDTNADEGSTEVSVRKAVGKGSCDLDGLTIGGVSASTWWSENFATTEDTEGES